MKRKVVITFSKDGTLKEEAFGFKGESCKAATNWLRDLFPVDVEVEKASFFETETEKDREILCQGFPSEWCG
jgi:hypothetical protein